MNYIVNEKLNKNPLYVRYLRENSHWYKLLNRNPEKINDMINEMKVRYQMRPSDKITNIMDTASLVSKIWSATKE